MMRHLEEFSRRVKLSGSREELESFGYLRNQLESYGISTNLVLHDAYISLPGQARIAIGDWAPDCITHSFSRSSGPRGVGGELIYAGAGGPDDFARTDAQGKIVLLEGIANPAASLRASQAGAIGQIHISPAKHLYEMCISSVWGNPTPDQLELLPRTVVLSVRNSDGEALKSRLLNGEAVSAVLTAEVDTGWRKTPMLEANLEADHPLDDSFVLFSGHHDTWYYGVMDNGSANAAMLEAARIFALHRQDLRRHLRLCFWSGHSHGRYSGSSWYADVKFKELSTRCVAHVNIDSIGARGNTVLSDALSSNELYALAAEAVSAQANQKIDGHRMSRAGDQSFWGIGIPSIFMAMGEQPAGNGGSVMGPAIGGGGARKGAGFGWWWHTPDDTLDKIDPELLVRDTSIYVHAIGRLLTDEILPLDIQRQVNALQGELTSLAQALEDRMDIKPVLQSAGMLGVAVKRFQEAAKVASRDDATSINRALIGVTRALVPIDYTRGSRFDPDPALRQNPYPVLDPLRSVATATVGSDQFLFASVAARRAVNRVAVAIDEALAALGATDKD
ncbi:M28 family peptidase [Bradyrhizobium sp. WSM3983]|uniref:M28 family peptidase n=1 Tax=Bradyrhizobium sp. WSM3983 TaxID=1038867 RepID=UPI0004241CBB|nr:M28 family peptidase [Bradyrhizobium sp. WSM3983]